MAKLLDLCNELPLISVPRGEVVLEENEKDGVILILKSGAVEILKQGTVVATISNPGAMLGEIAVLLERGHSASAVAIHDCEFFVLERAQDKLASNPDLYREISRALAQRLLRISDKMVALQDRYVAGCEPGELSQLAVMWGFE